MEHLKWCLVGSGPRVIHAKLHSSSFLQQHAKICNRAQRREIITVRGQSYVSRLPKYCPPPLTPWRVYCVPPSPPGECVPPSPPGECVPPSPPGECVPPAFLAGGGHTLYGAQYGMNMLYKLFMNLKKIVESGFLTKNLCMDQVKKGVNLIFIYIY